MVRDMAQVWDDDGFEALPGVAAAEALGAYDGELEAAHDRLLVRSPGDEHPALAARHDRRPAGAVDPYAVSAAARELLLGEPLAEALSERFGGPAPLLIDAVESAAGPFDDGPHRDTTYVATSAPEALLGLVVAQADGVTLAVYPGSQRIALDLFSGRYHHHNPERDGAEALADHREQLAAALTAGGHERRELTLAAGDVLVYSGLLVHEPVAGRALVGHVLPAHEQPGWFAYRPQRSGRVPYGPAWLASQHYDLDGAVDEAPTTPQVPESEVTEETLELTEEAMERHDSPPGEEPRRRGGLAGAVRGIMGRRGRQM
jgi:hypothetical protein